MTLNLQGTLKRDVDRATTSCVIGLSGASLVRDSRCTQKSKRDLPAYW
jgi:hypothetical protein